METEITEPPENDENPEPSDDPVPEPVDREPDAADPSGDSVTEP
jgi:hypothetical protein